MQLPKGQKWIPLDQFHELIGGKVSLRTLRRYCANGAIPASMLGRDKWYVDAEGLLDLWDEMLFATKVTDAKANGLYMVEHTKWSGT